MSASSVSFAAPPRNRNFRRRPSETDDGNGDDDCTSIPPSPPPNLSSILQLRKKLSRRGLEVSSVKPTPSSADTGAGEKGEGEGEGEGGEGEGAGPETVTERFTHQTGQMLDVDKHMMAYIESEMQKRRGGGSVSSTVNSGGGGGADGGAEKQGGGVGRKSAYWTPAVPEGRGATLGKLHEVDLGEETKKRNIARTQEATRRLQGGGAGDDGGDGMDGNRKKKAKGRKRRTAQDIERDKLVEEVLKESRLEMYTEPDPSEEQRESEGAADDRIAEKFRREFLDALMSRRRRRGGDHKKKRDGDKKPRGPKLGGSRQARAAMRESQNAGTSTGAIGKKK